MIRLDILLIAVSLISSTAFGQNSSMLKERCEAIVVDSISYENPEQLDSQLLYRVSLVPFDRVKDVLMQSLKSNDSQVRFLAAEILIQKTQNQFENQIKDAVRLLELKDSTDKVQRSVTLMKLGDEIAKKDLLFWSEQRFDRLSLDEWACPMICVKASSLAGKCAVCGMDLAQRRRSPNRNDWEAKLESIRALQNAGMEVSGKARFLIASNAHDFVRLQAAGLWAKENQDEALPHIQIFLHSDYQFEALSLLADIDPAECIKICRSIISGKNAEDPLSRMVAYRALLKAGDQECLQEVRQWVEQPVKSEEEEIRKIVGITLLGESGLPEDISRLEKLLTTKFKTAAAIAILQAMNKGK